MHKSRYFILVCTIISATALCGSGPAPPLPRIANAQRLSDRIISGATPEGSSAFAQLYAAGVRVVVSVDGMPPDVDTAAEHQLRYVHIPIGYDSIPEHAVLSLVRVVRETKGGIFIHCHHGVHRGPAAAAIAWRADTGVSAEAAVNVLEAAGTGSEYTGLWDAVRQFERPPDGTLLPELRASAPISPLADRMARIGQRFDRLDTGRFKGKVALQAAVLLRQDFRELLRSDTADKQSPWGESATRAEQASLHIVNALRSRRFDRAAIELELLRNQCVSCHDQHR